MCHGLVKHENICECFALESNLTTIFAPRLLQIMFFTTPKIFFLIKSANGVPYDHNFQLRITEA